jgi:CheY-like chemotaxis protein
MNTPNLEPTAPTRSGSARRRVLVLESDHLIRTLIVEWLGMAGADALCATDLADARQRAQGCDLILVDVPAPYRAARRTVMQLAQAIPHAPIIAMSADVTATCQAAREALARELGARAVLVKPFSQHALLTAIQSVRP